MSSAEPASCVFISTSRDHPIHMWDAFTGGLRASYRAYDHLDEVVAANSVCFNAGGDKIFAGEFLKCTEAHDHCAAWILSGILYVVLLLMFI